MKKGFTLIELMVSVVIIAIIGTVATLNLGSYRRRADLTNTTKQIGSLLREAQSDAMARKQQSAWGVHFDNSNPTQPFYALFYTLNNTYAANAEVGHYILPSDLCYVSSTVAAGSTTDIIFNSLTGTPGAAASISLQLGGCGVASTTAGTPTIGESATGKIFFDDFNRSNL